MPAVAPILQAGAFEQLRSWSGSGRSQLESVVVVVVGTPPGEHLVGAERVFARIICSPRPSAWWRKPRFRCHQRTWRWAGFELAVAIPAVGDRDRRVRDADERIELLEVCTTQRSQRTPRGGGQGPQRPAVTARPPADLTDTHRALVQHPSCKCTCGPASRGALRARAVHHGATKPVSSTTRMRVSRGPTSMSASMSSGSVRYSPYRLAPRARCLEERSSHADGGRGGVTGLVRGQRQRSA